MAPPVKEGGENGRRKSMSFFSRGPPTGLPQINTDVASDGTDEGEKKERKKLGKRNSIFALTSAGASEVTPDGSMSPVKSNERLDSPKMRARTLQKGRPSSLFGSFGRKSITYVDEEEENLASSAPLDSPLEDGQALYSAGSLPHSVLYHGEIQTTSGMFRKKKEYLVLTDTHLIRFKTQSRASETFPSIQSSYGRSSATRHPSTTSIGSLQDVQSTASHQSSEIENRIPLEQVVTVYKVEDGRPFFTTEVVYLDEEHHGAGAIQLMLHDPKEADLWHTSIRGAAQKARLLMAEPYPDRVIRYLVAAVEGVDDYDTNHFQVFRAVKRATWLKAGRSSSDDLQKVGSSVFYLVIGINRLHIIPIPDFTTSSTHLSAPKVTRSAHGIASLVEMKVSYTEDRFELAFRVPTRSADVLEFAASAPTDIAVAILSTWQFLKPHWDDHNFNFHGPRELMQALDTKIPCDDDELGRFDETLIAYCMAYGCNPGSIQYSVDWEGDDAPAFCLWPPVSGKKYSIYELLSIMRALRYNETFRSISFKDVDLHALHGVMDPYGNEHVAFATRSGISVQKYFQLKPQSRSLLYQEVQALALKSRKLRKMDFNKCLPKRRPRDTFDIEGGEVEKDPGSEIVAALFPLCQNQITNVNWITLSGIELGETDLDDLIPAFTKASSGLRAVECSHCGLNDRGIMQVITHLERQNSTLEVLDISENPGRIHLEQFQASMSRFSKLRKLNISKTTWTPGKDALILPEVFVTWHLEELILSSIPINKKTLESITTYLASEASNNLRVLEMNQCSLSGDDVALMMHAMVRIPGKARELQVHVSSNRLEKGIGEIVKAIKDNKTPSYLSLRMIEYEREEHFKELLQALRTNSTIRCLDISKASLPFDAGPETCEAMRQVFTDNKTLEELDISGEQAHLEVTRFGIGLNFALVGLKHNTTLKVLRVEYQNLGLEGANTLSSVIEANKGLTHIYCEHNDISLQGFTIMVNALAKNHSILEFPFMRADQTISLRRMNMSMRDPRRNIQRDKPENFAKGSLRRRLTTTLSTTKRTKQELTTQDMEDVVRVLNGRWDHEIERMAMFLRRNRDIANGISHDSEAILSEEALRPSTALSDLGILEQVLNNTTPKLEISDPVDDHISNKTATVRISSAKDLVDGQENVALEMVREELDDGTQRYRVELDGGALPQVLPNIERGRLFDLEGEGMFLMES